ncbi:uncharacterized protein LOC111259386 isoform X4 [Varroa jacobsoni]|uniref:uncharacterized protein LOC111259386 isoform X4 n=1 Tax=Varroa jacobsoni TaxID=62625 RepID=UPI000BFA69D2|nr:uncharacterized protein LOC111259386 isoform X4 [Varroa jacobsoni]
MRDQAGFRLCTKKPSSSAPFASADVRRRKLGPQPLQPQSLQPLGTGATFNQPDTYPDQRYWTAWGNRLFALRCPQPRPKNAVRSELPTVLASGTLSPTEPPSAIGPIEDWMLQIRGVAESDAGEYECNVNTQHPIISLNVTLSVLAPHASIVESPELYVNRGSTIKLTCIIHDCPQPLTHIFWYHQDKVINYERHANITIERATPSSNEVSGWSASAGSWNSSGVPQRGSVSTQVSRLLIPAASAEHSGRYTCAPIHSNAVVVHVHVLHAEEHLARKSHEASSAGSTGSPADRPWSLSIHASLSLLALELFFLLVVASTT